MSCDANKTSSKLPLHTGHPVLRKFYLLDCSPFFNTSDPRPLLKVHDLEFDKLKLNTSTSLLIHPYDRVSIQNNKVSEEDMSRCENGGVCDKLSKTCRCNDYWEGDFCHIDVDECSKNKVQFFCIFLGSKCSLNSQISVQQILFFLRNFSHLHALLEPTRLFIFEENSYLRDY